VGKNIEKRIEELINRILWDKAINLVRWELKGSERDSVLKVFIDKPGGITVDDCALVSKELSLLLELEEPVDYRYRLEVSSPGIIRHCSMQNEKCKLKNEK